MRLPHPKRRLDQPGSSSRRVPIAGPLLALLSVCLAACGHCDTTELATAHLTPVARSSIPPARPARLGMSADPAIDGTMPAPR